jgi:hypothetical protein
MMALTGSDTVSPCNFDLVAKLVQRASVLGPGCHTGSGSPVNWYDRPQRRNVTDDRARLAERAVRRAPGPLVNGVPAAVYAQRGLPKAVFTFTISNDKITSIAIDADPDRLRDLDVVFLSTTNKAQR